MIALGLAIAFGEPTRLAVVVSSNEGAATDELLSFADQDGDRVARVLVELGGVAPTDLFRVAGARADDVSEALTRAVVRAQAVREGGGEASLWVYYAGHAASDGLHLGRDLMPLAELKAAARVVPAAQRVFVVDACQAGQIVRTKGAVLVQVSDRPAEFVPPADEAWIASSGPEERAFEVERRRGALFTHFFVSGARGAADLDRDGAVTLTELYGFVQRETESAAADLGVVQRPTWAGELGDLVLTRPGGASSGLDAAGPLADPLLVVDIHDGEVAAELPAGGGSRVALPPGRYQLLTLGAEDLRIGQVEVDEGFTAWAASGLRPSPGVRARGGLVDPRPWSISGGYAAAVGASPGASWGHGGFVGARRSLGRGHRLEVGGEGGGAAVDTPTFTGQDVWGGARAQWGVDLASMGVRGGPAVEWAGGMLRQTVQRAEVDVWGAWWGDDLRRDVTWSPFARVLFGGAVEVPVGRVSLVGFLGFGGTIFHDDPPLSGPVAQGRIGLGFSP